MAAASNFGHGWKEGLFHDALDLGVRDFRDIIYWSDVETESGSYTYDAPTTAYPAQLSDQQSRMSLTVNWGNELYDDGDTPYTAEGREALARFVVATLDAHPSITSVEVGNEFNGLNFVTGPAEEAVRDARAPYHFEILKEIYTQVKAAHPEVEVLGGAAHSIPGGYLWPLLDLGAADYMDALVLHPYSTPPEQLLRQVAVLRRHDAAKTLPLQVTEFGDKDRAAAPGFLLRMYCAMALSGVQRAAWYPLHDRRGDDLQPLIDVSSGRPSAAGIAFAQVQDRLAGLPVTDVSPDPFTYACLFGDNTMVIWGEPRHVDVDEGLDVRNSQGVVLDTVSLSLSMSNPILISSDTPIALGEQVRLAPQDIIADSYHQFAYPEEGKRFAADDPFRRYAQRGDKRIRLFTMPGQDASGTPWTPYLGNRHIRPARLTAEALVPAKRGEESIEIVHRYVADHDHTVTIDAEWTPSERSSDGIEVTILRGDEVLHHESGLRAAQQVSLPDIALKDGDPLDFIVAPGAEADGDLTNFRITLREAK